MVLDNKSSPTTILKGNSMITTRFFQVSGKCHESNIDKCQDQLDIISDSEHTTIALCDGAGSSPYGKIAAQIISNIISKNLHDNFEKYSLDDIPNIKRSLTQVIDNNLLKSAKNMKIDPHLLATTILAVSMNNSGDFIAVHLGDGHILSNIIGKEQILVVSSPQKGYRSNSTYLTMNCPLFYYIRFYRWKDTDTKRIILLTDGMDHLYKNFQYNTFSLENKDNLIQTMLSADSFDDMSYLICEIDNR